MAGATKPVPPSLKGRGVYQEDLDSWETVDDVPGTLRDLPCMFGLRSNDLFDDVDPTMLKQKMESDDPEEATSAQTVAQRAYYTVLNLMRVSSGLPPTKEAVESWSMEELEGVQKAGCVNFGNKRQRSARNSDANPKFRDANDGEPGVMFRILSFKDNFFTAIASFRYYAPISEPDTKGKARQQQGKEVLAFVRAE